MTGRGGHLAFERAVIWVVRTIEECTVGARSAAMAYLVLYDCGRPLVLPHRPRRGTARQSGS